MDMQNTISDSKPPSFIFERPDCLGMDGAISDSNESTSSNDTHSGIVNAANLMNNNGHYLDSKLQTYHGPKRKLDSSDPHENGNYLNHDEPPPKKLPPPNGKKTKGRVKIKMEFIDNKLRRYTTFSKRKTGIMKKV